MTDALEPRRLAAILVADVVGYSRMVSEDEAATLSALKSLWDDIFDPLIAEHKGRIFKSVGDGKLVEFASAVDAVRCAVAVQHASARALPLRIGVHIGDVVAHGADLLGSGVNLAARLQQTAAARGILISNAVYDQIRGKGLVAFADAGELNLKNIDTPVRAWKWSSDAAIPHQRRTSEQALPSLAVLPFANLSQDAEQEIFADGLVEDIITTLSKLSGLTVIARNTTFLYKNRAVDVRQIALEFGVRFVLQGSVRRSGERIRVSVQLTDATTNGNIWAERYDRDVEDIFALQDEITLIVATEMQVRLTEGEQARLRYVSTRNLRAWTLWAEGLAHYRKGIMTRDGMGRARACWEAALAEDPGSSGLHAMLANLRIADARFGWWDERSVAMAEAEAHIEKALERDPHNADAYVFRGMLLAHRDCFDEAIAAVRLAQACAPGSADVAAYAAIVLANGGAHADAVVAIERAMRLSPRPPPNYFGIQGFAYRRSGRTAEAIAAFRAYSERSPGFGHLDLAIIFQQQGQESEARAEVARALAARPHMTAKLYASTQVSRHDGSVAADLDALRAAGLPE